MREWLRTAAAVPGFIGFAVGRTTFWEPLVDYRASRITRDAAVAQIAASYREWVDLFERRSDRPWGRSRRAPPAGPSTSPGNQDLSSRRNNSMATSTDGTGTAPEAASPAGSVRPATDDTPPPAVALLSNGRYGVMVTSAGAAIAHGGALM